MIRYFNIGGFIPSIAWIDDLCSVKGKMKKVNNFFDAVVEKIIDEHMEDCRHRGNQENEEYIKPLVDVLLEMAQNENEMKIAQEHIR